MAHLPEVQGADGREGLKDVDELQSYLIRRIERHINARGLQAAGLGRDPRRGLAPNATVMSWRGVEGGIAAARSGHHAVMSPGDYCYLDFCQDDPTVEPPAAAARSSRCLRFTSTTRRPIRWARRSCR